MKMRKRNCILTIVITALLAAAVTSCGSTASKESEYKGIQVASPDWVANLDAAASADQMLVVAAFNETATDAWVSLHEKQADGTWKMVMTTPGFIGKEMPKHRPASFISTAPSGSRMIRAARSPM